MPIRPDLRHLYSGPIWRLISHFVRFERAQGRCEECGRQHGRKLYHLPDGRSYYEGDPTWAWDDGSAAPHPSLLEWLSVKTSRVYLATAHLNNDSRDRSDENLKSLCQRCHLNHDREYHIQQARLNRRSKLAIRDLFDEVSLISDK